MVNFRDPKLVYLDLFALIKLCHTLDGVYIWEYFTTLDYECRVIQGRQPYRWTIWLYSLTRFTGLMAVIINIVTLNLETPTNCQVWVSFSFFFAFSAFSLSSLLIILRIIAIWNRNKVIVGLATIVWLTNLSFLIYGCTLIRSTWVPADSSCSVPYVRTNKKTIISMFITDFILLVTMLVGLFRLRCLGAGRFGVGHLLWKQGVIWLLLATVAELPPVVFICLNLNEAFDLMSLMPSLITMSIAATRMYRSLADSLSSVEVVTDFEVHPRKGRVFPNCNSTFTVPTAHSTQSGGGGCTHGPREVPVINDGQNSLYIGRDHPGQLRRDKPDCLCFDDDAEKGVQK